MDEDEKVVRDGQMLTARVWHLIDKISADIGVQLLVGQGGFKKDAGAEASGSTHNEGDVFDLRAKNLSEAKCLEVVYLLRVWNGIAWYRSPKYGWTTTGRHIHCVMRDSYYGLSHGAEWQVEEYDHGRNGLTNAQSDPFPQPPVQRHYSMEEDVPLTDEEIDKIADRVWNKKLNWAWSGKESTALATLNSAHYYSVSGSVEGKIPATAGTAPGTPTALQKILDGASGDTNTTLTEADVNRVAAAVVDLLSKRLEN